jgi:hypothetical protein
LKVIDLAIHPSQDRTVLVAGRLRLRVDDTQSDPSGSDRRADIGISLIPRLVGDTGAHPIQQDAQIVFVLSALSLRVRLCVQDSYKARHLASLTLCQDL